jgi:hypothetical protein
VWLRRPVVRAFADRPYAPSAVESRFMADYLADFDLRPDWDRHARGGGNSFVRMSAELLAGLDRPLPALDAALLAYHLPDLKVVEVAGCYLTEHCAGNPTVFSVAGQGVGASFTALRILRAMRQAGELADGAVFVIDQTTIPYRDPDTDDGEIRDGMALLCTDSAGAEDAAVLEFVSEQPAVDLAGAIGELVATAVRVVAGRTLAARLGDEFLARHGIIAGPRRQLCTSAWTAAAEHWPQDAPVVVADYDPHAGRLFQAGLRPRAQS